MELYCRQGRHGAALRQYRTCADLLAKELGIDPDATTKALRRDILQAWNQQQGRTSSGFHLAPAEPLHEIENEPPVTPRALERRQVTVLVCDLASIGELAGRLDPEDLQALIARLPALLQADYLPVRRRGGEAFGGGTAGLFRVSARARA